MRQALSAAVIMELGSRVWSCSDLAKGCAEMNCGTPDHEASLRKRIEETHMGHVYTSGLFSQDSCMYTILDSGKLIQHSIGLPATDKIWAHA